MKENLRYILTLTLICFVTASLLTGVYLLTQPRILEQKEKEKTEALKEVMPEAGYFDAVSEEGKVIYYRAYPSSNKQRLLGFAFTARAQGYSGVIETMAGIDREGKITGVKILQQTETPGLGARISEVLKQKTLYEATKDLFSREKKIDEIPDKPWFCAQFKGKRISDLIVVKTPTEKNIQAITGATISSEALTDSVREKAKEILRYEPRPSKHHGLHNRYGQK
ncbi:MAG: RnfABCDGE type electron transport complex subunit G [Candidatus Omnitrophota bacterium]|nr:MAG: RnfABCDGE type electron transport complex subunit G [Candidatus Omnitrophota bacterium]